MLTLHHFVILNGTLIEWNFSENDPLTYEEKHFKKFEKSMHIAYLSRVNSKKSQIYEGAANMFKKLSNKSVTNVVS